MSFAAVYQWECDRCGLRVTGTQRPPNWTGLTCDPTAIHRCGNCEQDYLYRLGLTTQAASLTVHEHDEQASDAQEPPTHQ